MSDLPVEMQQGERVIMRVRRHVIYLFARSLGLIVFGVIPIPIILLLPASNRQLLLILAAIWSLITFVIGYFIWYRYHYDEWVITNYRLIDSTRSDWFHQHVVSADLINIEDMTISKSGFWQTIGNFGDLRCETAGEESHFILHGIPNPTSVLDVVDAARAEARQKLGYGKRVLQPT
jgi:hypothetical protein